MDAQTNNKLPPNNFFLIRQPASRRVLVLILLGFLAITCRDEGVVPHAGIPPGKGEYVWSIDSIDYGGLPTTLQLESIWGSTSTDVWGVAGDAPDVRDCLWHFDGLKWSRATGGTPITEPNGNKTVFDVWGSAKNDVWAVGRKINQGVLSAFVMHYDGLHWTDATTNEVSSLGINLYKISGVSNTDIWVGGDNYALHFDGSVWNSYKVADSLTVVSMTRHQTALYIHLGSPYGKDIIYIFEFRDGAFILRDFTTLERRKFGGGLFALNAEMKSISDGILSTTFRPDGSIDTGGWHRDFSTPELFRERYVQTTMNVFVVGGGNLVYHYNGIDWKQLIISVPNHPLNPNGYLWGIWTDGDQVLICDWQNGIVYHGR
jgi:hypothetical protein